MDVSGKYLVNGEWLEAVHTAPVQNPANIEEQVGEVALCSQDDVTAAIDAAERAFHHWAKSDPKERGMRLKQAAQELKERTEEWVSLYVRENGKVLVEAKKDLLRCIEILEKGGDVLQKWWQSESWLEGSQKVQFRRRPRGVTAIISPWNSPLILTFKRAIPAILTGNTVVIKPASDCPLTVLHLLKVVANHLPKGVLNIVTGSGSMIGNVLTSDERVRTIAFTGSTETGKVIMRQASSTVKKLYMELGGNDPALILEDAELDRQAITRLRFGVLRAAGQVCSAIKRIYVHESRYEELVEKLRQEFQRVVVGNGLVPEVTMGPLNNEKQYTFVQELIERAKKTGAKVETYGQMLNPETWEKGYFMLPSIATDVTQKDELVQVEQFGPIVPVIPFHALDEALTWANDTPYGLRASVWTKDESKAMHLADQLEAGAVFHNNHTIFQDLRLDFPGIKESGLSRETRWMSLELFADTYGFAN